MITIFRTHAFLTCLAFTLFFPFVSYAQEENTLTLVNHYHQPLAFIVGINHSTVPNLPERFSLQPNSQIQTTIVAQGPQAYIRAEDADNNFAFFGVDSIHQVKFYGYLSKGIAFSWNADTIIFCTQEAYQQHRKCL